MYLFEQSSPFGGVGKWCSVWGDGDGQGTGSEIINITRLGLQASSLLRVSSFKNGQPVHLTKPVAPEGQNDQREHRKADRCR